LEGVPKNGMPVRAGISFYKMACQKQNLFLSYPVGTWNFLKLKDQSKSVHLVKSVALSFTWIHQNLSFYFSLYFEGSPPAEDP
jgi:hypothetical protein